MSFAARIANNVLNSKPAAYLTKPNAAGAAATIALVSNLSKDGVNCYYYVTQSMKNEKIPEEKRKFVAALDLSNGILNVITQLAVGIPIQKCMNKLFDSKIAPKYFSKDSAKQMYKKIGTSISEADFLQKFAKNKAFAKVGLSVIATLVGTQVIAKRVIVPLIATPMASFFKKKMEKGSNATGTDNAQAQVQSPAIQPQLAQAVEIKTPECFKAFN